jgi:hypothetical protein
MESDGGQAMAMRTKEAGNPVAVENKIPVESLGQQGDRHRKENAARGAQDQVDGQVINMQKMSEHDARAGGGEHMQHQDRQRQAAEQRQNLINARPGEHHRHADRPHYAASRRDEGQDF